MELNKYSNVKCFGVKKWGLSFGAALLGTALMGTPGALADESNSEESALDTIVVTGGRMEETVRGMSINTQIITSEELALNKRQNITEVLLDNGIQVFSGQGNWMFGKLPTIRGFYSNHSYGPDTSGTVMLLLNGRRSGYSDMVKMPTMNIDRIEIIRGAAGVHYGSNAVGGVVNVITKRGTENTEASFTSGFGSWGRYDVGGEFSSAKGPIDFSMGAYYTTTKDPYKTGAGVVNFGTEIDYIRSFSSNIGYNFNENNRLGFIVNASHNKYSTFNWGASTDAGLAWETNDKNYSFDFIYDGGLESERLKWQLRYFIGEDNYVDYQRNDPSYTSLLFDTELQGFQGNLIWDAREFNTVISAGFDWYEYDSLSHQNPFHYVASDVAGYLTVKTHFLDERLYFNAGVRLDAYTNETATVKKTHNTATPTFGVAYIATDNLKLRANWTRGFRVPSVWQSLADGRSKAMSSNNIIPNPDLGPETATTFELGFDYHNGPMDVNFTFFNTDYKDRLEWVSPAWVMPIGHPGNPYNYEVRFGQYQNFKEAYVRGFDFSVRYDIGEDLGQDFSLTPYVIGTYTPKMEEKLPAGKLPSVPEGGWRQMTRRSKLYVSWGIIFDHPGWDLKTKLNINHQGTRLHSAAPIYREIDASNKSSFSFSKGIYESEDGKNKITIVGEIDNLFDQEYWTGYDSDVFEEKIGYEEKFGYGLPGRSYYLGLNYSFK